MVCVRWAITLVAVLACLGAPVVETRSLPFGSGFLITHAIQSLPEFRRGTELGEQFFVLKILYLAYRGVKFVNNGFKFNV